MSQSVPAPLILTGSSGFLGGVFLHQFAHRYPIATLDRRPWQHNYPVSEALVWDFENAKLLESALKTLKPRALIHLAAVSNPNACEQDPEASFQVNVEATRILATVCAKLQISMVFASSDLVFSGTKAPYVEHHATDPINVYGKHKSQAEQMVLDCSPLHTVCRLPLMFGWSYNQGSSMLQGTLSTLLQGDPVHAFTDEYRSVAFAGDIVHALYQCIGLGGIIHLPGPDSRSRLEIVQAIASAFQIADAQIIPSLQKDVSMPAARPTDVSMTHTNREGLVWQPKSLERALQHILESELFQS